MRIAFQQTTFTVAGLALAALASAVHAAPADAPAARPATVTGPAAAHARFWPFDPPTTAELRKSPRKLVSHFHTPFPTTLGDKAEEQSYYTRAWLTPGGEKGKHAAGGGMLRQRPYPGPPTAGENWGAEEDVRNAIAIGMDAMIVNFVSPKGANFHKSGTDILDAAQRLDPDFKIILSPDCVTTWKNRDVSLFVDLVREFKDHPSLYRLDGRIVLSPWGANFHPAEFWREVLAALKAEGMEVAFVPCSHGFWDKGWLASVADICDGLMDSAVNDSISSAEKNKEVSKQVRAAGVPFWTQTVRPQDGRPKSGVYWEAGGSRLLRESWDTAIHHTAPNDWAMLFTWNDDGEFSSVRPGTGTQYAYFDLTAYYNAWFKTGRQPAIVRDVLYYFHRQHTLKAQPDPALQPGGKWKRRGGPEIDEIELLAFLKSPGTLEIALDGKTYTREAPAGITSFTIPAAEGTPEFRLVRGGKPLIRTRSRWTVSDTIVWDDMMYYAGSSSREPNLATLPPEPEGAVLDLRCNETWGPYVYDASPSRAHGRLSDGDAILHVTGREANGLYFGDSAAGDRYVSAAAPALLRPLSGGKMTFSAWVRPKAAPAGTLLQAGTAESAGISLAFDGTDLRLNVADVELRAPLDLPAGQWRHIAATFDGMTATLYSDGRVIGTRRVDSRKVNLAMSELRLGNGFTGWMDEIRMYPRALSAAEVASLR